MFDTNEDGKLRIEELQRALEKLHLPCSQEQTLIWMKAIDENHDDTLNLHEFSIFMTYAWDLIHENARKEVEGDENSERVLFLGGSCNPTTWRHDISIPLLEKNNVPYYNPQVEEWSPDLMVKENLSKNTAKCLLFVVDGLTRAIASMIEITEYITSGRKVVLVVNNIENEQLVDGKPVTGRELKDLNRGRAYLADVADRYRIPVYADVIHATMHAIKIMQDKETDTHLMMRKLSILDKKG